VPQQQRDLTCERDGTSTRLTCVRCATPVCPLCLVRTPVGMKCATCGAEPGALLRPRKPVWVRLAPLAVVALVAVVLALPRIMGGGSTGDGAQDLANDPVGGNPRPQPPVNFGVIGQEVLDESLGFTVTSFECGAADAARAAQGKFCVLALSIRNTGRSPVTFVGRGQTLQDSQQRTFGPDTAATAAHAANAGRDLLAPVVNPGNELRGALVFDVPVDVAIVGVSLRASPAGPAAFVRLA